jgi:hypothetical protein
MIAIIDHQKHVRPILLILLAPDAAARKSYAVGYAVSLALPIFGDWRGAKQGGNYRPSGFRRQETKKGPFLAPWSGMVTASPPS